MSVASNEKPVRRGTDETFLQLMQLSGGSLLKLLGFSADDTDGYRFRATVFKPKHMAPDVEGIPTLDSKQGRVFIEFQGYRDPWIRYRLAAQIIHACLAMPDDKPVRGAIVYTETAWQRAALPLEAFATEINSHFHEIVLTDYTETQLLAIDPCLVVLTPFTAPKELAYDGLRDKIRYWGALTQDIYPSRQQTEALNILGLFLLNRFRVLTSKEVCKMLNLDFSDHPMWREAHQKGIQEGRQKAMQQMLFEVLLDHFGAMTPEIKAQILELDAATDFNALLIKAIHCNELDEFSRFMATAKTH